MDADGARRRRVGSLVAAAVLVGTAVAIVAFVALGDDRESVDHRFVIPAGTADRVASGEPVEILPARLELHVGDTVTLVNEDDAVQRTGFLTAEPHETVSYRFGQVGTFTSECTLHPSGNVEFVVRA